MPVCPGGRPEPPKAEDRAITWELIGGLLLSSIVSGLIPVVNAELLLIGATVLASGGQAPVVAGVVTLGQMMAKAGLYFTARWAPAHLPRKAHAALGRGSEALERRPGAVDAVILFSAIVGLPPFYAVTVAAGALHVSPARFLGLGTLGRALRFGTLAWAALHFGEAAPELLTW